MILIFHLIGGGGRTLAWMYALKRKICSEPSPLYVMSQTALFVFSECALKEPSFSAVPFSFVLIKGGSHAKVAELQATIRNIGIPGVVDKTSTITLHLRKCKSKPRIAYTARKKSACGRLIDHRVLGGTLKSTIIDNQASQA